MQAGKRIDVVCDRLSHEGNGVCRVDNLVVFVPNLLPREEAVVEIDKLKRSFATGKVVERKKNSCERVTPECDAFFTCGGCDISHMNKDLKNVVKYNGVVNNLRKQGFDLEVENNIENPDEYGYRSKVVVHAMYNGNNVVIGPYKKGSYDVVSNDCLMLDDEGRKLHNSIVTLVNIFGIEVYNYKAKKGLLRTVVYRKNDKGQYMVTFVTSKRSKDLEKVVSELKKKSNVSSIIVNINKGTRNQLFGRTYDIVHGEDALDFTLDNLTLKVSHKAFFQVNEKVMKKMYQVIKDNVEPNETVLDAYSGVGSISLYLADKVKSVTGIELNESSFKGAELNRKHNEIKNATFINGDVSKEIESLEVDFDVVVTDPPRSGCSSEFIDFILENKFKKVIYMSCNSATLARDIKLLEDNYEVEYVGVYDMFAHTYHSEVLTVLKYKG